MNISRILFHNLKGNININPITMINSGKDV